MDSDRIPKKGPSLFALPVIRRAAGRNFRFQGVKGKLRKKISNKRTCIGG
jgi:hypothetical protein